MRNIKLKTLLNEILVKNKKTGNVYNVVKMNPQTQEKPTPSDRKVSNGRYDDNKSNRFGRATDTTNKSKPNTKKSALPNGKYNSNATFTKGFDDKVKNYIKKTYGNQIVSTSNNNEMILHSKRNGYELHVTPHKEGTFKIKMVDADRNRDKILVHSIPSNKVGDALKNRLWRLWGRGDAQFDLSSDVENGNNELNWNKTHNRPQPAKDVDGDSRMGSRMGRDD